MMTTTDLIKQLFFAFSEKDNDAFIQSARDYIEHEKRKKHTVVAKDLEKALFSTNSLSNSSKRFKNSLPIPRDAEKGFPLLEIQQFDKNIESLIVTYEVKKQLEQIIKEFKDSDIFATYNLQNKKKILLCGKPGTGKTFSAQIISSVLNIPLVYVRFDAIISSYLGETATNLRKVFDYIESNTWVVLFDEFDVIGKNRDDNHEHGEIKRVVNSFLQMLDNLKGDSIILAATNHQAMLDPAIWRRFDDIVYYELPDENIRQQLFEIYLKPIKKDAGIDIAKISSMSNGFSPADIKMVAEEAMKIAIINSKNQLGQSELNFAIDKFIRREKVRNNLMGNK
jgi:SpoVK/Ycf46/Vps4 family AAA+-type ATPase